MNDQISNLFSFINSSSVQAKYQQFLRGAGSPTASHTGRKRFSPQDLEKIMSLRKEGLSFERIAEMMGASDEGVRRIVRNAEKNKN